MQLPEILEFIEKPMEEIPGWLNPQAARFTAYLYDCGLKGNALEFGVFQGKYLALLYMLTADHGDQVVGIDAFIGAEDIDATIDRVEANILTACGDTDRLTIRHADTHRLAPVDLLDGPDKRFMFISIDAGHEADDLHNDICLAADLIGDGGIIAIDDAFNVTTPGAIEGTCRFFERNNNDGYLAPFTHCYNKLFVTTRDHHAIWLERTKRFVEENLSLDFCERTRQRIEENNAIPFIPRFFGREIVPFL